MISGSNIAIHGGTFNNQSRTFRGMDILLEWVAAGAFHNSDELHDAPKCHPHTRVAVLDNIMKWVSEYKAAQEDFILWFFGPAGAGKSAIAKRIAEIAAERDLLIADFFFSGTQPNRNTKDRLIATLAYQLALSIPETRSYIEEAIERDPVIFKKNLQTQMDILLIKPFQSAQTFSSKKLIIIDGLDECNNSNTQIDILEAISHSFIQQNLPIKFLLVSRPETDLVTSFNCNQPLKSIHRRLALDDTYRPDDDIRLFLSDKFEYIKLTHPLRSTIPISWPTRQTLRTLVQKSSGQFIYASTVVKFVESRCHRPTTRLNIVLRISPPGSTKPFAQLDRLYDHVLSSVDDIQLTLRVLSLYVMTPKFASIFRHSSMSPELFLSLEPGDIHLALITLSSIVTYNELSGAVDIIHASFVDFLSDKHRSAIFYIDQTSTCMDFVRRILQYVKEPGGIQAGNIHLFCGLVRLSFGIPRGQHRSDILNFDLDAFINASIRWWKYRERHLSFSGPTMAIFDTWRRFVDDASLEDGDKKEVLNRLNKSLELQLQIYQSDWRLQLLVALAVIGSARRSGIHTDVPSCRCVDILLKMNDHDLHVVDRDAFDLRHGYVAPSRWSRLIDTTPPFVNGDTYALAALHCMSFLSDPPKYSVRNERLEMGIIYEEWKATCDMTLDMLCKLLGRANTSMELVRFISYHDIHPTVQKHFPANVWEVDVHIFAFLGRASVCPNWRIIYALQRSPIITLKQPSYFEEKDASSDEYEEWGMTEHYMRQRSRARRDQCCSKLHL